MARIKPFRGLRPVANLAAKVASPPYDVINSDEARQMAAGNPYSFLHINKPEIDLPAEVDIHDEQVYAKGRENLDRLVAESVFVQDETPCYYFYRQIMGDHEQIGLVAGASVAEYQKDLIKKHELTRVDKEDDRLKHILSLNAQTGPVFLTFKSDNAMNTFFGQMTDGEPVNDFTTDDGIRHTLWVVDDKESVEKISKNFEKITPLYVADGHHRSAAAARACDELKAQNPNHTGEEEYNYFLTVIFPHDQMYIMDYNRVVKDLNGLTAEAFLKAIGEKFLVRAVDTEEGFKPSVKHDFGMYLEGKWYKLSALPGTWDDADPSEHLDVSILYSNLLKPLLGIGDPRKDKRIDFVGGIRGMKGLMNRVDSGDMKVAFSVVATSINDLMAIADAGRIMPPKSTWFEPKLRSGLVIHKLD
jgi:uncharacterized protein (DUF1015 family)